jgi:predicted metal-dependent enzyme (double-stranded beta helix superfamily)
VVIDIYMGCEDNIFWRRVEGGNTAAGGAKALRRGDCVVLDRGIIRSVINSFPRLTGAIRAHGGGFFGIERRGWDPATLWEERYDVAKNVCLFKEINAALNAGQ